MSNTTTRLAATLGRATLAVALTTLTLLAAVAPALAASPAQQHRQATAARLACQNLPAKGLDNTGGFPSCYAAAMRQAQTQLAAK